MALNLLEESLKVLKKNPVLFLPDLVLILITYLLFYLIYLYTGVGDLVSLLNASEEELFGQVITTFFKDNLSEIILSVITFFVVTFTLGVGVAVVKYSMIKQVLHKKKVSIKKSWNEKKHYFWSVVLLRVTIFLIGVVALILIFFFSTVIYMIFNLFVGKTIALSIGGVVAGLLTILSIIVLKFVIFFRYPIMFLKEIRNPIVVLRKAYQYLRKNPFYVFVTWLIIFSLSLVSGIIFWALGVPMNKLIGLISITAVSLTLTVVWTLFTGLIGLVVELWGTVFLFKRYKKKS